MLSESDVAKRTELEERRKRLVEEALEAFRIYKNEVADLNLPESDLVEDPSKDLRPPEGPQSRIDQSRSRLEGLDNPAYSLQGGGQGLEGGLTDFVSQFGSIGDQISQMTQDIAGNITTGIGGAIT